MIFKYSRLLLNFWWNMETCQVDTYVTWRHRKLSMLNIDGIGKRRFLGKGISTLLNQQNKFDYHHRWKIEGFEIFCLILKIYYLTKKFFECMFAWGYEACWSGTLAECWFGTKNKFDYHHRSKNACFEIFSLNLKIYYLTRKFFECVFAWGYEACWFGRLVECWFGTKNR